MSGNQHMDKQEMEMERTLEMETGNVLMVVVCVRVCSVMVVNVCV